MAENSLLIDVSNRWLLVGIRNENGLAIQSQPSARDASDILVLQIKELLEECQLAAPDWIIVTIGPGSFTGSRIGVSVARNLAQLWEIPVLGIDSLLFYGLHCLNECEADSVSVMIDAKQQKVYARAVERRLTQESCALLTELDVKPEEFLATRPKNQPIFCDDLEAILQLLNKSERATNNFNLKNMNQPQLENLYTIALQCGGINQAKTWKELKPHYLRRDPASAKFPQGINPR